MQMGNKTEFCSICNQLVKKLRFLKAPHRNEVPAYNMYITDLQKLRFCKHKSRVKSTLIFHSMPEQSEKIKIPKHEQNKVLFMLRYYKN